MTVPHPTRRTLLGGFAAGAALVGTAGSASAGGAPPLTAAGRGWVRSTLARMTLEEKVGQLFVQYVYGPTADDRRRAQHQPLFGVATPRRDDPRSTTSAASSTSPGRQRREQPAADRRSLQRPAARGLIGGGPTCRC